MSFLLTHLWENSDPADKLRFSDWRAPRDERPARTPLAAEVHERGAQPDRAAFKSRRPSTSTPTLAGTRVREPQLALAAEYPSRGAETQTRVGHFGERHRDRRVVSNTCNMAPWPNKGQVLDRSSAAAGWGGGATTASASLALSPGRVKSAMSAPVHASRPQLLAIGSI